MRFFQLANGHIQPQKLTVPHGSMQDLYVSLRRGPLIREVLHFRRGPGKRPQLAHDGWQVLRNKSAELVGIHPDLRSKRIQSVLAKDTRKVVGRKGLTAS